MVVQGRQADRWEEGLLPTAHPRGLAQDSLEDAEVAGQADDHDDDAGDAHSKREVLLPGPLVVWKWEGSREPASYSLVSISPGWRPEAQDGGSQIPHDQATPKPSHLSPCCPPLAP